MAGEIPLKRFSVAVAEKEVLHYFLYRCKAKITGNVPCAVCYKDMNLRTEFYEVIFFCNY